MTDATFSRGGGSGGSPAAVNPIVRAWGRVSPSIVPVLAVVTALIITVPFMVVTRGGGNISEGLRIAGSAYAALLEGSVGLAVNPVVTLDDVNLVQDLADNEGITRRDLLTLSRQTDDLVTLERAAVREYAAVIERMRSLEPLQDQAALEALASRVEDIRTIGSDRLREFAPLLLALDELPRRDVSELAESYALLDGLDDEQRQMIVDFVPAAETYDDATLLDALHLVNEYGIVRLVRVYAEQETLDSLGLEANDPDIVALQEIYALETNTTTGFERIAELAAVEEQFITAGIANIEVLADQLRLVSNLYGEDVLVNEDVAVALREEMPAILENSLVVRRPGNRVLLHRDVNESVSVIYSDSNTPEDTSDDEPETVYARLGGQTLLFFPSSLETMLTRSIPFVIAGLAVALGFKAGLFNIGAEGQLYAGAIVASWIGFAEPFISLPPLLHVALVLIVGFMGGAVWGMIPGMLKAFTGAHEVINTIMLNFIAINLVDWLIKSTDPVIFRDMEASTPRTPFIAESAMLPTFDTFDTWLFFAAGLLTLLFLGWLNRERIQKNIIAAVPVVVWSLVVVVGGLFLQWITVRGNLHFGFVLMILVVWFIDWFLERTTLGFELRTVGANPDAARYAGMNVKWNIALALTLSGALAGLAGTIEISGVQHNMQPAFFAGLGFDSIAVALLARNNPRSMIPAGILWGALLAGAGLMQVRADISIDLVKIIQALIIMFIAADAIIRVVWRIPEATAEEKAAATFSKGWGG